MNRYVTPHLSDFIYPAAGNATAASNEIPCPAGGEGGSKPSLRKAGWGITEHMSVRPEPPSNPRDGGLLDNGLSQGEAERLALVAEECGEVVQVVGKVLRHGFDSRHPQGGLCNRQNLERELGDLQAAIELMIYAMDLDPKALTAAQKEKWRKLKQWTHHQGGIL